ncbi:PucR family transcriptional regulator [Virgibacillus sp. MSP4-1]|uniref:PucR family transcriptional regulator n=1 Tax=Virgibacillus sp. MSP4-1 TaxID=2700081 RepID=UPI0003A8F055|nr:PucR family transcriptional regulator ligand-binding domain-containing protein [Virgibacillus sp. MSP4-1]QHS23164.1 PucR family transcriptional regulator [Virgibacillus sp. MSP4-1]
MRLAMEEILQLDLLNEGSVVTDEHTIRDSIVEWISVIEMPVENFVRKNEFVLTTGVGCKDDEELLLQFVKEVIESEASGLAIAIGRYIHRLPERIIHFANQQDFPIILLPWEIRFADAIQVVLHALKQEEERLVEKNKETQQELLNLILKNGSLYDVADYIEKKLDKGVIITDTRGRVKGKSRGASKLERTWTEFLQSEDYRFMVTSFENNHPYSTSPNARVMSIEGKNVLQFLVHSASEIQGFVIVEGLTDDDVDYLLGQQTVHLLEHAVTAIALCFLKENTIIETELKLRDDFVWSLAKEKDTSWDQVLSRAKSLKYNVTLPYVCIIGYPENFMDVFQKNLDQSTYEHWEQTITRRIEDEIYYSGKSMASQTMITFQRSHFIIYLEVNHHQVTETVDHFFQHLDKRLNQFMPELIFSWGISKTAGLRCFYESYQEAQKALEIGRRQKGPGFQNMYADTRVDRALMNLVHDEELKNITDQTIGTLLNYDQERGINLVHTFSVYNKNRGNVSQTARELNLHRQSLLYRLRKIESLTDCDLDKPDDLFLINLCIRLWTLGILESRNDVI